jgi:hypothetical protein
MRRLVGGLVVLLFAVAAACGAVTAPFGLSVVEDASVALDSGVPDARSEADHPALADASDTARDATADADAADAVDTDVDAGPPCDPSVLLDAAPCATPPEDTFTASPGTISVSAGTYGVASFVLGGPWASAPNFVFTFAGTTLQLQTTPYLMTNRPPASFAFLLLSSAPLGSGTFSVTAQLGNMLRTASVTVDVTACQPSLPATACEGAQCGFVIDNCGGKVNCGTCPTDAPTCYLGQCISGTPNYCPAGEGIGQDGTCVECAPLPVCQNCPIGNICLGLQDQCVCVIYPFPPCPAKAPHTGDECPGIGETCNFSRACGVDQCQCGPDYTWSCGVIECGEGGTGG